MLVAALVVVLSRTGVVSASNRSTATASLSPATGGTLVVDVPSVPTNLNPHTVAGDNAVTRAVADLIWPQSYTVGPGLSPQLDGAMLSSVEVVSVDPQTVVYHIDSRARWSDGQPIRAADFEYLWHQEATGGVAPAASGTAAGAAATGSAAGPATGRSGTGAASGAAVTGTASGTAGAAAAGASGAAAAATATAGTAVTGTAVTGTGSGTAAATAPRVAAPGVVPSAGYGDIQSVTGSQGGTTVTVVFRKPFADWPALFDNLMPPQVASAAGWVAGFASTGPGATVSGGPWEVHSWQPGQRLVLVPNPQWWGPAPKLARLVLQARPSTAAMVADLAAGRAQLVQPAGFGMAALDALSSMPALRSTTVPGTTMLQLVFDTTRAPFDQQAARQGVAHLLDRTQLVRQLVQPLDPSVVPQGSYLFATGQAGYHSDGGAYAGPHPNQAARLLAQAGIVPDPSGRQLRAGVPVTLTLAWAADDPWSALVGPAVAAQLEAAGFAVRAEPVPGATLTGSVLPGRGWDLALVPLPGQAYPSRLVPAYATALGSTGADQVRDWSGFDSPAIDALLTQARSDLSAVGAGSLYHQADQALWTAMPALPLFTEPGLVGWASDVANVVPDDGGAGVLWNAQGMAFLTPGGGAVSAPGSAAGTGRPGS